MPYRVSLVTIIKVKEQHLYTGSPLEEGLSLPKSVNFDLSVIDMGLCSDGELIHFAALIADEQRRRAFERGDLPELIDDAFDKGFSSGNKVGKPWVRDGILVAPGGKFEKSPMSHRCTFVRVADDWVWESSQKIQDEIRHLPGAGSSMRSITLLTMNEGDKVDVLTSRTRSGVHELLEVQSFIYHNGELDMTTSRTVRSAGHR